MERGREGKEKGGEKITKVCRPNEWVLPYWPNRFHWGGGSSTDVQTGSRQLRTPDTLG